MNNFGADKKSVIESLKLEAHPLEGGYFRRTYESDKIVEGRKLLTSIYYLLTNDSPIGYMHRNRSDILHFYHGGSAIKYMLVSEEGVLEEFTLGMDLARGEHPQLLVKGGTWKIAILRQGDYGLLGEAVSPGFEYNDNELATSAQIQEHFPALFPRLQPYIKPE